MKYLVVIPARLASSRLPNKPLVDIEGKSMIQRTYERCLQAVDSPDNLIVATDHVDVFNHIESLGYNAIMTSDSCLTGTDRVAEVARRLSADYYINVQGDEPLIDPKDVRLTIDNLQEDSEVILNGYSEINNESEYLSLSIPKVVFSESGKLIYMSRAPIPGNKSGTLQGAFRQICIYAFPKSALEKFSSRDAKTQFEDIEDIEILRFIEMDIPVQMLEMTGKSIAVDTHEDLEKVRTVIRNM